MSFTPELCEVCQRREAAVFMVIRQGERVAKTHACFTCFELAQSKTYVSVEAVSLQEFKEIREAHCLVQPREA